MFCLIGQVYLALGANPTNLFVSSSFFLEAKRLSSMSLVPLIDFLTYMQPELWLKNPVFHKNQKLQEKCDLLFNSNIGQPYLGSRLC